MEKSFEVGKGREKMFSLTLTCWGKMKLYFCFNPYSGQECSFSSLLLPNSLSACAHVLIDAHLHIYDLL